MNENRNIIQVSTNIFSLFMTITEHEIEVRNCNVEWKLAFNSSIVLIILFSYYRCFKLNVKILFVPIPVSTGPYCRASVVHICIGVRNGGLGFSFILGIQNGGTHTHTHTHTHACKHLQVTTPANIPVIRYTD